ncbi:hypothetical protein VTK26DRAFT_7243 [Humicola hyalothermophila]
MAATNSKSAKVAVNGDKTNESIPKKSLFDDSESSSEDDQEEGGAELKINTEYARRFEHNKKREELHRLQEKYKTADGQDEESESSSEDETEDDDAVLITEDLDAEISATLQAIKNKDPRIYDKNAVFYKPFDPDAVPKKREEKPLFLRDYHRERYLSGDVGADDDTNAAPEVPKTYAQEQADIKKSILAEINAAAADDEEEWSDDDAFIKPVKKEEDAPAENGVHPSRAANITLTELDVANADKNPEEFLNKFMASKAWAPDGAGSKWQAFESDEGEGDDDIADEFEHAYNMRFEDPAKSNEFLKTYSRSMAAARSARKEELTGRKKQRALEKERKEAEKKEREAERARLRRLKVEEASEKLAKIKKAAGLRGKSVSEEEWLKILDDAWDDDKWEETMKKHFGDEYYAEAEDMSLDEEDGDEDGSGKKKKKKKKAKKPKWDDDIDIKDIIPDFDDESKPNITLTDEEAPEGEDQDVAAASESSESDDDDDSRPSKKRKTSKDLKKDRIAAKRQARAELAKIEALVDTKMELENPRALQGSSKSSKSSSGAPAFRYRETSPNSFGLTARDILLAPSDAALNEFAGLKKLATFRDPEKKRRDKKRLGKKARLRQWRRETFGREYENTGPTFGFEALLGDAAAKGAKGAGSGANSAPVGNGQKSADKPEAGESNIIEGERKKKRKRSKKKGKKAVELAEE